MNVQFFNNGDYVPQPKHKVKIEELRVEVYPDRRRVWVNVVVTPFQERPNLLLSIQDVDDQLVGEISIIETMHFNNEFTMHLRRNDPTGDYTLKVDLFYESRNPPQAQKFVDFQIPPEENG